NSEQIYFVIQNNGVFFTSDSGNTIVPCTGLSDKKITRVWCSPVNSEVWASNDSSLFLSENGSTWVEVKELVSIINPAMEILYLSPSQRILCLKNYGLELLDADNNIFGSLNGQNYANVAEDKLNINKDSYWFLTNAGIIEYNSKTQS